MIHEGASPWSSAKADKKFLLNMGSFVKLEISDHQQS
jgi:hypothetical protein